MSDWIQLVGAQREAKFMRIRLVGANSAWPAGGP